MNPLDIINYAGLTFEDFLKKRVFPAIMLSLFLSALTFFIFHDKGILVIVPFFILILGFFAAPLYLFILYEKKRVEIDSTIHLFITYIGAIASLGIPRGKLFEEASKKEEYGEITNIIKRIYYLARCWGLGFAKSCRKISRFVPSRVFSEFLDRFSAALDFGEPLDVFLWEEQKAVMDSYEVEYKKSLRWLEVLQDIYTSLLISFAFVVVCAILLPFVIEYSMLDLLAIAFFFLLLVDFILLLFVKSFIVGHKISHNLKIKCKERLRLEKVFRALIPLVVLLAIILIGLNFFSLDMSLTLAITPLLLVGIVAKLEENAILSRDNEFPAFIRSLGGAMSARGGSIIGTLESLRVHDFGVLNEHIEALYRRLKLGTNKSEAWEYFSGETGSHMIYEFSCIFIDVLNLGGDVLKASEIISNNFTRILDLRKLRLQMVSGLRGIFYGSVIAVAGTVFIGLESAHILYKTFSGMVSSLGSEEITSMVANIVSIPKLADIPTLESAIFIILLIHAAFTAILIKMLDGGNKYAAFLDFVIMTWLIFLTKIVIEVCSSYIFGSVSTMTSL